MCFNGREFKSLRQPRLMYFSTKRLLGCLYYQFYIMLLHCGNGTPQVLNRNIPYPLGSSPFWLSLSYRMLRTLLVPSSIQRFPQVCPLPSLLNTFPDSLISSLLPVRILSVCPLVSMEVRAWEHVASTLGLTLVRQIFTALKFSPIPCLSIALDFHQSVVLSQLLGFHPSATPSQPSS